jgi:E3 ubiquitin-protein ligase HUWE1
MFSVELITYLSIKEKVDAIMNGFYSIIPYDVVSIFTPEEFDFLLSGQSEIDLNDWKCNTIYKGFYNENHPVRIIISYLKRQ